MLRAVGKAGEAERRIMPTTVFVALAEEHSS